MSIDKTSMDKGAATGDSYLYFMKIIDDGLYTISPDHVYMASSPPRLQESTNTIEVDGETFKIAREST